MGRFLFLSTVGLVYVFLLLPIVYVVISSFNETSLLTFPPQSFTLRWYTKISGGFVQALKVSMIVALATSLIATVLGLGIALALARGRFLGRRVLSVFALSPLMVPHLVIGVALFQFSLLFWDWTAIGLAGSIAGLIIGHTTFSIPFVVRAIVVGHALFDTALEEAALTLGATPWQTFLRITLPVLMPGVISGAIFAFIVSFDDVPVALFMGGGNATTLPVKIFTSIEFSLTPDVMAVSALIIYASLGLMIVIERTLGLERFFGAGRA